MCTSEIVHGHYLPRSKSFTLHLKLKNNRSWEGFFEYTIQAYSRHVFSHILDSDTISHLCVQGLYRKLVTYTWGYNTADLEAAGLGACLMTGSGYTADVTVYRWTLFQTVFPCCPGTRTWWCSVTRNREPRKELPEWVGSQWWTPEMVPGNIPPRLCWTFTPSEKKLGQSTILRSVSRFDCSKIVNFVIHIVCFNR